MREFRLKLSKKQEEAWDYLNDSETTELFYGGGAGGGKSFLGCAWLVFCCLKYPGSRWLMGRARQKTLKESTLLTLFHLFKLFNLKKDKDWKYNFIEGVVHMNNGSDIYLKDLFAYPADPEFDSLGSTEYTGAFVDEVSEITEKSKNIVMSRLRYKLDEFGIMPKLLLASNPAKNFAYREYWKPWKEGTLPIFRKFVPALVGDNPFISSYYAENLNKLDKKSKERLLFGNWNYDDDPSKLFDYDKLNEIFTNKRSDAGEMFISADIARFGSDKTILILWVGLNIEKIYVKVKTSTTETARHINEIALQNRVNRRNIVIDEDGVGGGVVDQLNGVKGFINNSRPIELKAEQSPMGVYTMPPRHNFANLKTQCYFKLADYVQDNKISFPTDDIKLKEMIVEDLEQIKVKDIDKDGKVSIIPKEEIIENLGHSPDVGDALMMRMIFELVKQYKPYISTR
jgi:phage terminase large subunit